MGATLRDSVPAMLASPPNSGSARPRQFPFRETPQFRADPWGTVEQTSSISVCLSGCIQRAALRTPPPFGRTLSFQTFAPRLSGMDSSPEASSGPSPQISSTRLGSRSHRHTLRASMYRIQRTNLNKRS